MKLYIALSLLMLVVISANANPVPYEGNSLQTRPVRSTARGPNCIIVRCGRDVHEGVEKREPLCPHGECY